MQNDLSCCCYGLTPAEIELIWSAAPPRMPIPPPQRDQVSRSGGYLTCSLRELQFLRARVAFSCVA
jgi:hypothetical protein